MKTKTRNDALDVRKLAAELKDYEDNPNARGGVKIKLPVREALKMISKMRPSPRSYKAFR